MPLGATDLVPFDPGRLQTMSAPEVLALASSLGLLLFDERRDPALVRARLLRHVA